MYDYDDIATDRPAGVAILKDMNSSDIGLFFTGTDVITALSRQEAVALADAISLAVL